jgi:adenine deaminase
MDHWKENTLRTADETRKLMEVALGERFADLAVTNATLVNVYTGELLKNISICAWGKWFAYVGSNPGPSIGPETRVIDATGKSVIPGLIDGHSHMGWPSVPETFLEYAMRGGTTTIITETMEPYPVSGLPGVVDFLESCRDQPIKIFATAPAMVSLSTAANGISVEDLGELLSREEVVGLGESYWQAVLQNPGLFMPAMRETLRSNKVLEGHSAGASERKLMAYAALGISSCHEPIKPEEVLDRLRMGLHVMVREGSIRKDLEAISKIKDMGVDLRRVSLVSDGVEPGELMENGYMEHIVRKAIHFGFEPVTAVQMATLNVAEHFRLDHLIGGIAPGRFADMLIVPDVGTIRAEVVISNGVVISQDEKLMVPPRHHTYTVESLDSIRMKKELAPLDFKITLPAKATCKGVRAIEMVTDLVTKERILELPSGGEGTIHADPALDLAKIAAIDRTNSPGKIFVGLIKGFGLKSGAMACSAAWDSTDIIVVGVDDLDMARAVNRIVELRGGAVICRDGNVLEELPLPVFGVMSQWPIPRVHERLTSLRACASTLGVSFPDPLLSLVVLTGAAIPFLRICEEGLVGLRDGKPMGIFVEDIRR